ncbi:ABC transporter permease [Roseicyclus mahoneyensis]|uniref:Peptide/nickel transport system permease protein n=1 Tax=Roseicyclus mahoneyensis TaxID=164332 RepID=A0A316GI67_9RHOB|nr:ABC transporter permease [Roseicyclus mahoneyensis]PWK60661.1 peptide/nickel transport system permease protein [Roseicyclus mahoneyensis]
MGFAASVTLGLAGLFALAWVLRAGARALLTGHSRSIASDMPLTAAFGLLVIVIYAFVAIAAPLLAPFPERDIVGTQFQAWSADHPLGTDRIGRDMLSRLIYGARNTVGIAFATTALAFVVGSLLGLWAALTGGWLDQILSRFVDALMAIPALIFSLLLLTIFGTSVLSLILVIAAVDATRVFRLARSVAQGIVVMDYIEAARLRGEGAWFLIRREILPNAMAPLVAEFGLRFCFVFLSISSLSFLGLGIKPPTADWGSMVRDNATLITFGDVTPLLPAGCIALLTVAVNFVVDWQLYRASGLREATQ